MDGNQSGRTTWPLARLALALLLPACGSADANGRWAGTRETLPNGAVRVTNPAQGIWSEGTSWQLVQELVLGDMEGPEATVFASISGLEVDAQGRIYVLDRQANEMRIFTPDGAHVRTVGRSGGGPGEYRAANGLLWLTPDTIVVVDQQAGRYSMVTRDGEFVRSVPRQLPFQGWLFRGGYKDGRIYESWNVGTDRQPALLGTPLRGSSAMDTVPLPPEGPSESFSVRTARAGMVMGVPFAPGPARHVDGGGNIWHGQSSEFRIVRSSFGGDTLMEILLDEVATPVTAAELAEWEGGEGVKQFREMGGQLDLSRIPKVKPFFDGLYVDTGGYLWVSVPAAPMEVVFAVFDPEGRYLGRLQADGFERVPFLSPAVRNGRLHLVGRDELDVQRVYVFRIER